MELVLKINCIQPKVEKKWWWSEEKIIEKILTEFKKIKVLTFNYVQSSDKFEKFKSSALVAESIRTAQGKNGKVIYICQNKSVDSNFLEVYANESVISITANIDYRKNENQIELLKTFFVELYQRINEKALFGSETFIRIQEVKFPRYRPQRDYKGLQSNAILNFIDTRHVNLNPDIYPRKIEKILHEKLPEPINQEINGSLHTITWFNRGHKALKFEKILMDREEFLYNKLDLPTESDFNDEGHKRIFNISALEKTPKKETFFSYYNPRTLMFFKLVTLTKDSQIDSKTIKYIEQTIQNGKSVQSELNVNKVVLILPSKSSAMQVQSQAILIGVYKMLFLDNDANLWDLEPNGDWRN